MMRNNDRRALWELFVSESTSRRARAYVRPYRSIEAVAAVGSKYFINVDGEVKSFGSATTFPFLEDLSAELIEFWR